MILDNKNSILRIKQSGLVYTMVFVVIIMVLLYIKKEPFKDFGITKTTVSIILAAFYTYFIAIRFIKDYNYFAFQDLENKLVFRYYSLKPFNKTRNLIEIEKNRFAGYKIKTSALKLKRRLFLYQNSVDGLKKFPGISVTAVSKKNLSVLSKILKRYVQD